MAGYSGTPLSKKLGLKPGSKVRFVHEPPSFQSLLEPLPPNIQILSALQTELDLAILFVNSAAALRRDFSKLARSLQPAGMLWVAWPKKSSGVSTDLNFDVVQKTGLSTGLVDVKICAIDEIWSGLKFVIRKENRKSLGQSSTR
ncbi:MAG: DUF3052 domain-containing protein [Verrucomicrobiota bacterium]